MDRTLFLDFNKAFAAEPTEQETQLVNNMLHIWGKLEPAAGRNPSNYRRGIIFGLALQKGIAAGEIKLRPVKSSTAKTKPQEQAGKPSAGE